MSTIQCYNDIHFNVDLVDAALKEVECLRLVDEQEDLYEGPLVKQAIFRYETLWLPLLTDSNHDHIHLTAPLDIAWVWHCHMLAPLAYFRDCNNLFGKIISHKPMVGSERSDAMKTAESLWIKTYPDIPFFNHKSTTLKIPSEFVSRISYDLQAAISRQRVFYYQVSLPHYTDKKFLERSVIRYKKFLFMKKVSPNSFIVPCYDIDLIWHAHQLNPVSYKIDTIRTIGEHFNHDDSVNDRSGGSKLCQSMTDTQNKWKELYNEQFSNVGSMYRGLPPNGRLDNVTEDIIFAISPKIALIEIENIEVVRKPGKNSKKKIHGVTLGTELSPFIIEDSRINAGKFLEENPSKFSDWSKQDFRKMNKSLDGLKVVALKKPDKSNKWSKEEHSIKTFEFDSGINYEILIKMKQARKIKFFKENIKGSIEINTLLSKCTNVGNRIEDDTIANLSDGSLLKIKYGITIKSLSHCTVPCTFKIEMGGFVSCIMPELLEDLWGPINIPPLPKGIDNVCSVASHKLVCLTDRQVNYTCRIIHSLPLLMSAIHVFCKDKLSVVCQLIGSDQLPIRSQVQYEKWVENHEQCVTFDPIKFERAILIKNNKGDWGIVMAHWEGFQRGIAPKGVEKGTLGNPGYLKVRLYKMSDKSWITLELKSSSAMPGYINLNNSNTVRNYRFTIGGTDIDLINGTLTTQPNADAIAEHIAVAFAISLLHVLCQPHQKDWEPGNKENLDMKRGTRKIKTLDINDNHMFTAAGMAVVTPSNHHIRKVYGKRYYPCYTDGALIMYLGKGIGLEWGCDGDGAGNGCGFVFDDIIEESEAGLDIDGGVDIDGEGDGAGCGGCGGCIGGNIGGGDSGGGDFGSCDFGGNC